MWELAGQQLQSHLLLGTAQYPSLDIMQQAILAAKAEVITVSLRRQSPQSLGGDLFWRYLQQLPCHLLPNTAGCRHAREAVNTALMARDIFETSWIKLEVIGDDYNLQPDPFELIKAAEMLIQQNFEVFPYCTDDLVLCQRLVDSGCRILMPWAAPIGSGKGLLNPYALMTIRERLPEVTLIVDAGIGKPSDATQVMEFGVDGVLLNSAVSLAKCPIKMAEAFALAVEAGRLGYVGGMMPAREVAVAATPLIDTPFWHQEKMT